jgi:hypothetical protein
VHVADQKPTNEQIVNLLEDVLRQLSELRAGLAKLTKQA